MNLDKIFFSFRVFDLRKKGELVHGGFGASRMEENDRLECNIINYTNSIDPILKGSDLTMRFDYT